MKRADEHRQAQARARRQRVAFEAARLMAVHGIQDAQAAKRRAARQLGIDDAASLPDNSEVQEQLRDYQRLFRGQEQPRQLRLRREAALQAMQFFSAFEPRLVGQVLDGTADAHSPVSLQVFSDDPDAVARLLLDANMPASTLGQRRLRVDRGTALNFPAWSFTADDIAFEVVVLPLAQLRQAPIDPGNDKPMQRAGLAMLRQLLDEDRS